MAAQERAGWRGLRFVVSLSLALIAVIVAAPAIGQSVISPRTLACQAGDSTSAAGVGQGLLNQIQGPLNQSWQAPTTGAAAKIANQTFDLERVHLDTLPSAGCNSDVTKFCEGHLAFSHCSFVYVNLKMHNLAGLDKLRFTGMNVTSVNERNVSEHSNRGPDASVITDGVFATEHWDAADPAYVIVMPHNTKQGAIVIDLGQKMSLCGVASGCTPPTIQADNDDTYHLDYSSDGSTWSSLGDFPTGSCCGLVTRKLSGSGFPANFSARYIAVYATKGGNTFAISELQLWDTTNALVTQGKPTVGPVPYEIVNGNIPPNTHSSGDSTVSVVLPHQPGLASALTVDLGGPVTICGRKMSGCLHEPSITADNDDTYMLDYSINGTDWTTYGNYDATGEWHSATFANNDNTSGLLTRDMACSARPDTTTACSASNQGPDFKARYLRVYARKGGNTFAVAELSLWNSAGDPLATTPTFTNPQQYAVGGYLPYAAGPEPFYTNGQFAQEGTTWNDGHYAVTLGACTATHSCPPAAPLTAAPVSAAKQIDLTAVFPITRMVIQAEYSNHYQVDGWDGTTMTAQGTPAWTSLWSVPPATGGGLRTRTTTKFNVASPQARYIRFYATSGTNGEYSVSEIQVFTSNANTGGTFANMTGALQPQLDGQGFPWSDGRANDGQGFACTYDGNFDTSLGVAQSDSSVQPWGDPNHSALPITFTADNVELWAHCVTDTTSGDYRIAAATNRDCAMTLIPPADYAAPFTDAFQAGQCASPQERKIMSYMRFDDNTDEGDNSAIQFISKDQPPSANPDPSDLQCPPNGGLPDMDAHIPAVLRGFVPVISTEAVRQALNQLLGYRFSPGNLIPFPVTQTGLSPPDPATKPVQCDDNLTTGEPPTPAPDNISSIVGKATQVGSGGDSATLRISGNFTADQPVSLDLAGLKVDALLQEVGLGERVEGPDGGAILLPIGLDAQNGSKPNKGMYRTPPGAKPIVTARIDAQGPAMSFAIDVERAAIAAPESCLKGSPDALLRTSFAIVGGSTNPISVRGAAKWQCKGAQLVAP